MELLWITRLLLGCLIIINIVATPSSGLRRVPKVYNALITSDQNLAPSKAYPVIQPIIHRTAVGYLNPYYYTPVGPEFIGPDIYPIPVNPQPVDTSDSPKNTDDKTKDKEIAEGDEKDGNKDRVPLSFYPNYQSVYFNPYLYGYNVYPHVTPGTYYVNYQPPGPFLPPPPPYTFPQSYPSDQPTPNDQEKNKTNEKQIIKSETTTTTTTEKVPEVPLSSVPRKQYSS
ncbi:uncharacterized protein [Chelonus insularis]|uniref:uncharacterized protein n=1 Tax=Chelonus insularis TaxID=460826 RepID=UPI00158D0E6F|nr:uncharacterized protein LOC118064768 [Chelonus insularis]XP_034935510.1 uncharacterized protein LOC118064768 [Chelonus insularis]